MKKILFSLSAVAILASCSDNNPRTAAETKTITPSTDTAGFAQFQQWKAQNELAVANQTAQQNAVATEPVKERIVYVDRPVTKKKTTTTKTQAPSTDNSGVYNSTDENTAKKKGWSKSAKGAVIGGAGGAVLGAVINKRNRGAGAVIGGILGAGGGYVIGKNKDKKDGRN